MSKRKRATGLFAALVATAALAVPVVASAGHPGQTVELKSTISINPYGSAGKVSSSNANCAESRQVVVKEKGVGKIGSAITSSTGSWKAEPKYKGNVPLQGLGRSEAGHPGHRRHDLQVPRRQLQDPHDQRRLIPFAPLFLFLI